MDNRCIFYLKYIASYVAELLFIIHFCVGRCGDEDSAGLGERV